jgi:N-acetylmuramoyl-L-alanine amidase
MSARGLSRRSLLSATAGAVAGGLLRPRGALAALAARMARAGLPEPRSFERAVGTLPAGGRVVSVELRRNADLLGVLWSGPASAQIELRFRDARGGWSRWVSAGSHGHAPEAAARTGESIGDPVWSGGSSAVQLRSERALRGVRLSCVDVSGGAGARAQALGAGPGALAAALPLAMPNLAAGPGQPPIVARRAWARGICKPRVAPEYGAVHMAFVHHTENPNGYTPGEVPAMLRAIYVFHRYTRGWNDIGYNFVIDLYGRIFEARAGGIDEPVVGAQAGGYNLISTGVAVLGEFMSVPISPAAASALQRLLAWKLSLHGIPSEGRVTVRVNPAGAAYSRFPANARVSLPRVAGHRDADTTDCPGNVLYRELPAMRPRIRSLAGSLARASIALGPAAAPAPGAQQAPIEGQGPPVAEPPPDTPGTSGALSAPPEKARTLTGSLTLLDGSPLGGAPVAIQAREVSYRGEIVRERTIAQLQTSAEGTWSLPVTVAGARRGVWLRALCPGVADRGSAGGAAPVVVSVPLHVPGVVSVTSAPPAAPAPTPEAAAPPAT